MPEEHLEPGLPSSAVQPRLTPTEAAERIDTLDILRGFALFGILAVNMFFFANPFMLVFAEETAWTAPIDRAASFVIELFCQSKFYSLFSLLFGYGAALQMLRLSARGKRFGGFYLRRLFVLFLIGAAHVVFLWPGDILIMYSMVGVALLLFHKRRDKTLLVWAVICLVAVAFVITGLSGLSLLAGRTHETSTATSQGADSGAEPESELFSEEEIKASIERSNRTYSEGTYGEIIEQHVEDYVFSFLIAAFFMFPSILGMFLVGFYAGRRGLLRDPSAHRVLIRRVLIWGSIVGVLFNLAMVIADSLTAPFEESMVGLLFLWGWNIGAPALCLAYVAAMVTLLQADKWHRRLRPLAAVGRMALTNYLLQSLICTTIYNSYGLGFFGKVGPAVGLLLTVAIFALQIPLSNFWLRHFRFGPAEWLWRSLTYGRAQGMKSGVGA
ncbi:MAG: DUF418 domain-containing protein [Planctomycetota bacterium]